MAKPASVSLDTLLVRDYNHKMGNLSSDNIFSMLGFPLVNSCDSAINFKISLLILIKVFQNTYFPDTCMILNTCCWFEKDFPMEILIALSILDAS